LLNSVPGLERPARAVALSVTYLGKPSEGERLLEPLKKLGAPLADLVSVKSYLEAQGAASAPVAVPTTTGAPRSYTKTGFLRSSSTALFDELVRRFAALPYSIDAVALWGQIGGAVSRVAPDATAYWNRMAEHDLIIMGNWTDGSQDESHIGTLRSFWSGVERFTQGFYVNTEPGADDARVRATYGNNYARLRQVKNKYDPGNRFRLNANIRPS